MIPDGLTGASSLVGLLALALSLGVLVVGLFIEVVSRAVDRFSTDRSSVTETVGPEPPDPAKTALPDDPRDE